MALKAIKKSDSVAIYFGEWFDKTYGNTYYDAEVHIGAVSFQVAYKYGYNAGDNQAIDEALASCGYRVRANKKDRFAGYKIVRTFTGSKLKRELFK